MKRILTFFLLMSLFATAAWADGKDLYVYIWSEYLPDSVVEKFSQETGIRVHVSTYDSNEAMYAKLKMVGEGFDLIVPSTYFVSRMSREGMLMPLDKSKLPNYANLDPRFTSMNVDPEGTYSVPYMWGSTAIAVNTDIVASGTVSSFEDLWRPELAGKILLPNDPRDVIGMALKTLGHSFNDTDPEHLRQAYEKLKLLVPGVRVYDSDSPHQALLSGEVAVGVIWNGEAYIANSENPSIEYIYPKEGFGLWLDSFCIPQKAKNIDEAHAFLNFILRPDISAEISVEFGYATPNLEAVKILPAEERENRIIYPSENELEQGEFQNDLGEAVQLYDNYWVKLK